MAVFLTSIRSAETTRLLYQGPADPLTERSKRSGLDALIELKLPTPQDEPDETREHEVLVRYRTEYASHLASNAWVYRATLAPGRWARLVAAVGLREARLHVSRDVLPLIDVAKLIEESNASANIADRGCWVPLSKVLNTNVETG